MQQTVGGEAAELKALYLSVSRFAQELDPKVLSGSDATLLHNYASRIEGVAATIKGLALLRVDETDAYRSSGHRSAADFGAAKTGTSPSEAQRAIKRAKNAQRLPKTDDAMRNGDISPQQADAITDAARVNPDAETDLLRSAKTDDLGTLKKKARRAKFSAERDAEARTRRIHARRSLKHWTNEDGEFHAHLCTTPEAGARLLAGLEPHRKAAFESGRKAGRREPAEAYAADALDALARNATPCSPANSWTEGGSSPEPPSGGSGGDRVTAREARQRCEERSDERSASPDRGSAGQDPPTHPTSRSQPRATVHLNVDAEALARGHLEPGDICEIPGVGPVSLSAARALLGDATIELIIKKGNDIRSVVHYGRTVTAAQRRALEARDPCCIRPGCGRTQNLEIDHRDGWAITHQTSLDELARLCPYEHDLKTHHGHTYSGGPGNWKWHTPDDPPPEEPEREDNESCPHTAEQTDLFSTDL